MVTFLSQILTSCWLNIVHRIPVHLKHLTWLRLLLLVTADGKCVLGHLNQHKVPLLPLLPDVFAHSIHVTVIKQVLNCQKVMKSDDVCTRNASYSWVCPYAQQLWFSDPGLEILWTHLLCTIQGPRHIFIPLAHHSFRSDTTYFWWHRGGSDHHFAQLLVIEITHDAWIFCVQLHLCKTSYLYSTLVHRLTLQTGSGCEVEKSPWVSQ